MRYIIDTQGEHGSIGAQVSKWEKEKKVVVIEKGNPVVEIKAQLERVAVALQTLKKVGYNSKVMKIFIAHEAKVGMGTVGAVLASQEEFFRQIGLIPKNK